MMKKLAIIFVFIVGTAACSLVGNSDKKIDVTFETTRHSYALGDTVVAVLRNNSNKSISYNLCGSPLEQKESGKWVFVGPTIFCNAIAFYMKPGEQATYRLSLIKDSTLAQPLTAGIYRLKTGILIGKSNDITLYTHPFHVGISGKK